MTLLWREHNCQVVKEFLTNLPPEEKRRAKKDLETVTKIQKRLHNLDTLQRDSIQLHEISLRWLPKQDGSEEAK